MATSRAGDRTAARSRPFVAVTVVAVLAATLASSPAAARQNPGRASGTAAAVPRARGGGDGASFDSRAGASPVVRGASIRRAQQALAASLGPLGLVDVDERTGTPRIVARLDGFLTGPSLAAPADIALDYVRAHLAAFGITRRDVAGLRLVRDYVDILGTHHLIWEQRFRGLAVWDNDLRAHVTSDGRLVAVGGSPMPGPSVHSVVPSLSAGDAIAASYRSVGAAAPSLDDPSRSSSRPDRRTLFRSGDDARLVLFGTPKGATLAWRTTATVSTDEVDLSLVDATTGSVLWRANMVKGDDPGTGQAWEYYPSATVPSGGGVQHQVTFPVADGTSLFGNNAWTYPDVNDDNSPDREIPATSGLDWSYPATLDTTDAGNACSIAFPCSWQAGVPFSWRPNVEPNAVQVFHFLNTFHDHLLAPPIGFTEAAGNFQVDNATGQGLGGDPVVANVMDGADTRASQPGLPDADHVFNANMLTPPDGNVPLMQMYLFPSIPALGVPATNGGDDGSVVYHEYTHGLSNRLVTFADGSGAVNSAQSGAMGEAWSDFYAMDYLVSQALQPDSTAPDVIVGRYVGGGRPDFIRSEAIDCPLGSAASTCPGSGTAGPGGYTYGDFGNVSPFGPEVHNDGEIWVQTLWDIRAALGSEVTLALVTRGMELSPPEPSFLDMRNAILEADEVAFGGAHQDALWQLFAHRGMGFFATAVDGSDVHPVQDFSTPPTCPGDCGTVTGTVIDAQTGSPVAGVNVAIAGHASGFGSDLVDATDGGGAFSIADVPFHDYVVTVQSDRHEPVAVPVNVNGVETLRIELVRDWAALGGGASLVRFTGPDYSPNCGPSFAWNTSLSTGWGSDAVSSTAGTNTTGPRINTVKLPRAVDISAFGFATNGTCGDGPEAAVKVFKIQTRTRDGHWRTAYHRSAALPLGVMNTLVPRSRASRNVRYVKLIMLGNYGDPRFMDMLELSVRGVPA